MYFFKKTGKVSIFSDPVHYSSVVVKSSVRVVPFPDHTLLPRGKNHPSERLWLLVLSLPPPSSTPTSPPPLLLPHSPPPPHTYSSHSVVHSDHSQIQSGDSFTVSRILRLEMDFVALTLILPTPKITLPQSIESVLSDPQPQARSEVIRPRFCQSFHCFQLNRTIQAKVGSGWVVHTFCILAYFGMRQGYSRTLYSRYAP